MGYRGEERGGKSGSRRKNNQKAWSPQGWRPNAPVPITVSWSPHQAPTPSASHMFWNLSPGGGGVAVAGRPLSGPGGRLFSQLLVPSAQCEGEQLSPGLWNVLGELRSLDWGAGLWLHIQGP